MMPGETGHIGDGRDAMPRRRGLALGSGVLGVVLAVVATAGPSALAPSAAAATPTVRVVEVDLTPDGVLTLSVEAADLAAPGLGAATLDILFDPAVLRASDCHADPTGHFDTAICNARFDANGDRPDIVRVTAVSVAGATGSVSLARITFQVMASATSTEVDLALRTFTEPAGSPLPATVVGADLTLEEGRVDARPLPGTNAEVPGGQSQTPAGSPSHSPMSQGEVLPATPVRSSQITPTGPLAPGTASDAQSRGGDAGTGAPVAGTGTVTGGRPPSTRWIAGLSALAVTGVGCAIAAGIFPAMKNARNASRK